MISNLVCFNSAKTVFLLLGLRPQLNKIHNPVIPFNNGTSVSPAVSARNLGIIFDSHITFEIKFLLSHVRASTTSVIFVAPAAPSSSDVDLILKSLYWLRVT